MRIDTAGDISTQGRFAMGAGALTSRFGEKAFANGSFAAPGDAQSSVLVLRRAFPIDPNPGGNDLTLNGEHLGPEITIPNNHSLAVDIQGVVRGGTTGNTIIFGCQVVVKNVAGTISVNGASSTRFDCPTGPGDSVPVTVSVGAPPFGDHIDISVATTSGTTEVYRIVATVRTTEVGFAAIP
jgi:hypothetical protein